MSKVHVDDLISWHVVNYSKLSTNQFITKLCPFKFLKQIISIILKYLIENRMTKVHFMKGKCVTLALNYFNNLNVSDSKPYIWQKHYDM